MYVCYWLYSVEANADVFGVWFILLTGRDIDSVDLNVKFITAISLRYIFRRVREFARSDS